MSNTTRPALNTTDTTVYNTNYEGKDIPEFTTTLKANEIYIYDQFQDNDGEEVQFLGTYKKSYNPHFCFKYISTDQYFEVQMNQNIIGKFLSKK